MNEKNTQPPSPEVLKPSFPEVSPEAQKRAAIMKLFREKFKDYKNITIEPERENQAFVLKIEKTIQIYFDIYSMGDILKLSLRSIENRHIGFNYALSKSGNQDEIIDLASAIITFIDTIYHPDKYNLKEMKMIVLDGETIILGISQDKTEFQFNQFNQLIHDKGERSKLIRIIAASVQRKSYPIEDPKV